MTTIVVIAVLVVGLWIGRKLLLARMERNRQEWIKDNPPSKFFGDAPEEESLPPEVERVGLTFVQALVEGRYEEANGLIAAKHKTTWAASTLKSAFEAIVGANNIITDFRTEEGFGKVPDQPEEQIGWVYISIGLCDRNDQIMTSNTAVSVAVLEETGEPRIGEIEWGRP